MSSILLWLFSLIVLALFVLPLVLALAAAGRTPTGSTAKVVSEAPSQPKAEPSVVHDSALAHFNLDDRVDKLWESEEGPLVQQTIVISGKQCTERLQATVSELRKWDHLGPVSHLHAIWRPNGAEGCMQSHIAALRLVAASGKNTLIVEDDFTASVSSDDFDETQRQLASTVGQNRWDMLIVSLFAHDWAPVVGRAPLMRIFRTTTTGAYLVSGAYAAKLRDHWEDGHAVLRASEAVGKKSVWRLGKTEIDQSWAALSRTDRWYSTVASMAQQRPGITTIAGTFSDNSWTATPDLRHFLYRGAGEKHRSFPMRLREPVTVHRIGVVIPDSMTEAEQEAIMRVLWPEHYVVALPVQGGPPRLAATAAKDAFQHREGSKEGNDALVVAQEHELDLAVALPNLVPTSIDGFVSPPVELMKGALDKSSGMVWYDKWQMLVGTPSLVSVTARKCLQQAQSSARAMLDSKLLSTTAAQFGAQTE